MRAIQFHALLLKVNADNLGLPLHADEFRFCRMLYAASDINPARNDVCYRDFLALVLSPPFASPDEGVAGDGSGRRGGERVVGGGETWHMHKRTLPVSDTFEPLNLPLAPHSLAFFFLESFWLSPGLVLSLVN